MIHDVLSGVYLPVPAGFQLYQAIYLGQPEEATGAKLAVLQKKVTFRPNLVLAMGAAAGDGAAALDTFVNEQVALLKRAPHYRLLERQSLAGPHPALLTRQTLRNSDGVGVEQLQLYVGVGAGQVVLVTATHLAGAPFRTHEPVFRAAMAGLRNAQGQVLVQLEG